MKMASRPCGRKRGEIGGSKRMIRQGGNEYEQIILCKKVKDYINEKKEKLFQVTEDNLMTTHLFSCNF